MDSRRLGLTVAACFLAVCARAQTYRHPNPFIAFGQSARVLGTSDIRNIDMVGVSLDSPRLHWGTRFGEAHSVLTFYGAHHYATGSPAAETTDLGAMIGVRLDGRPLYFQGDLGLQIATRTSIDLDSELSSTPSAELGFRIPAGRQEVRAGIRWFHISNAGTVGHNRGQNFFMLALTLRR